MNFSSNEMQPCHLLRKPPSYPTHAPSSRYPFTHWILAHVAPNAKVHASANREGTVIQFGEEYVQALAFV